MTKSLLIANNLVAGYNKPIIGPVSFSIEPGQVIGLWGANGCGKSTLLRVIANNTNILAGTLELKSRLKLAWQMQKPVQLDEMPLNGYDYLRYAKANRTNLPKIMLSWLDSRIDRLSGGQFQLLAVWAILGAQADLVLLDEPTNNLDPCGQNTLVEILQATDGERGVLLVSHEYAFLEQACDKVINIAL